MSAHVIGSRPTAAGARRPLAAGSAPASQAQPGPVLGTSPGARPLPHWRVLLESRWQERLRQITELSLAYHDGAAAIGAERAGGAAGDVGLRDILRRTVAARRALADIEEALTRLAAGRFGRCEQCEGAIPAAKLALIPETRYCPACTARDR